MPIISVRDDKNIEQRAMQQRQTQNKTKKAKTKKNKGEAEAIVLG